MKFTKMQGLGNDFVVVDSQSQPHVLNREQIQRISDRRYGVGCDQLLVFDRATQTECEFRLQIYNADGSEAQQCGNGVRCAALYMWRRGLVASKHFSLDTRAGVISVTVQSDEQVTVDMGAPHFSAPDLPASAALRSTCINGERVEFSALSMGNPHAVIDVADVDSASVAEWGAAIDADRGLFSEGCNVGFVQIVDRNHLRLRVFERGVGETPACGSGACAAAVAAIAGGGAGSPVAVEQPGGKLLIEYDGGCVQMTGPASFVFDGEIIL